MKRYNCQFILSEPVGFNFSLWASFRSSFWAILQGLISHHSFPSFYRITRKLFFERIRMIPVTMIYWGNKLFVYFFEAGCVSFSSSRDVSRMHGRSTNRRESANNLTYPRFSANLPRSADDDSVGAFWVARCWAPSTWPPWPIVSRVGIALIHDTHVHLSASWTLTVANRRRRRQEAHLPRAVHFLDTQISVLVECQICRANNRCLSRYFSTLNRKWLEESRPVACPQLSWRDGELSLWVRHAECWNTSTRPRAG